MTDVIITRLEQGPRYILELWGDPRPAAERIARVLGHPLPRAGRAEGLALRSGPTTWLIEGDGAALAAVLGADGALTPVGGGLVPVRLSGPGWRSLLMEGGLFDAEHPEFAPGCAATTLIEHVSVILRVESPEACLALIPASHAADLLQFWQISAGGLPQ